MAGGCVLGGVAAAQRGGPTLNSETATRSPHAMHTRRPFCAVSASRSTAGSTAVTGATVALASVSAAGPAEWLLFFLPMAPWR